MSVIDVVLARYWEEMGREPPSLPVGDPLAWQWDPALTRRELLARLLEEEYEEPAPFEGQESLL